jgi:hypothetical protein
MSSLLRLGSIGRSSQEDGQGCWGSRAVCFWRNTMRAACTRTMKSGWGGLRLTHRPASANTTALARPVPRGMRGQCRRAPEATDHGPLSGGRRDQWSFGLWHLGANLLRRIRRPAPQEGAGEDRRGVMAIRDILAATDFGTPWPQSPSRRKDLDSVPDPTSPRRACHHQPRDGHSFPIGDLP